MNKKIIVIIFIGTIVIIGSLIWLGQPSSNQNSQATASASLLKSSETLFDFGTISMANGKVSHEFKITNSSVRPVNIRKIYSSCMCTAAKFKVNKQEYGPFGMEGMGGLTSANVTLNPGDSGTIEAVYDPNAHGPAGVGSIDRFIYLEDKNSGKLELEIKAVVTP